MCNRRDISFVWGAPLTLTHTCNKSTVRDPDPVTQLLCWPSEWQAEFHIRYTIEERCPHARPHHKTQTICKANTVSPALRPTYPLAMFFNKIYLNEPQDAELERTIISLSSKSRSLEKTWKIKLSRFTEDHNECLSEVQENTNIWWNGLIRQFRICKLNSVKIEILERTQAKIKMELKSIIRKLKGSFLGKIYEIEDRIQRAEVKAKELDNWSKDYKN